MSWGLFYVAENVCFLRLPRWFVKAYQHQQSLEKWAKSVNLLQLLDACFIWKRLSNMYNSALYTILSKETLTKDE